MQIHIQCTCMIVLLIPLTSYMTTCILTCVQCVLFSQCYIPNSHCFDSLVITEAHTLLISTNSITHLCYFQYLSKPSV